MKTIIELVEDFYESILDEGINPIDHLILLDTAIRRSTYRTADSYFITPEGRATSHDVTPIFFIHFPR